MGSGIAVVWTVPLRTKGQHVHLIKISVSRTGRVHSKHVVSHVLLCVVGRTKLFTPKRVPRRRPWRDALYVFRVEQSAVPTNSLPCLQDGIAPSSYPTKKNMSPCFPMGWNATTPGAAVLSSMSPLTYMGEPRIELAAHHLLPRHTLGPPGHVHYWAPWGEISPHACTIAR